MVLAIYMPCCVREFLYWLYRIAVAWDHALGVWIDAANRGDDDYDRGISKRLPE